MADKITSQKTLDITTSAKPSPNSSSRPIIVGHKTQIEDPMMVKKNETVTPQAEPVVAAQGGLQGATPTAASSSQLSSRSRVKISPVSPPEAPEATEAPKSAEEEPSNTDVAPETSDEATINAVAEQTGAAKKQKKLDEEEQARQAAMEALVESKKYFVPISEAKKAKAETRAVIVVLVVLLLALVAANLAIDAGIIKTDIQPIVDLIN